MPAPPETAFEAEFQAWLATLGEPGEGRRLVRSGAREILVSKLEPDVLARVQQTMLGLSELLAPAAVRERYEAIAAATPGIQRVAAWRLAIRELLAGANLSPAARNEAEAGTDSVAALLEARGLAGKRVAVERNGEIVPKSQHAQVAIAAGDRIEIVVAVGGG